MNDRPQPEPRAGREQIPPFEPWWWVTEILLQRWRWLALGGSLLAILALLGGMVVWKRSYLAVAQLLRYEPMVSGDYFKPPPITADTFASLLKSPELLERVGTNARPAIPPAILSKIVFIKTDVDSDVVKVAVKGVNKQAAVNLANLYAAEAVRFTLDLQKQEAEQVNQNYLKQRLTQMDSDIHTIGDQFRGVPNADAVNGKLALLGKAVTNISEQVRNSTRPSLVTARLTERLQTALDELNELTKRYQDTYPSVVQKREQIHSLEQQISQSATNQFPYVPGSVESLSGAGRSAEPDYEVVRSKLQALANSRQILADRQQEAQAFAANPPGNVRLFAPAAVRDVIADKKWLKVALLTTLGGLLGVLFAAGGVMLVELVDNRIKTVTDVQRITRLPVIATLEDLDQKGPAAREKWGFRTWTILQGRLSPSNNHGLVCGITSSGSGEGRSTWINLLAEAASMSGFRVLTIATRPSTGRDEDRLEENSYEEHATALTTNALACPSEVTQQLTGSNPQPLIHIPLPGWVWNLERRRQWQEALNHWRTIENLVILVELPPASVAEAVLLGANLPNLLWLTGSGMAEAGETRSQLETLRHARSRLVGAVLNREPAPPLKSRFPRWVTCLVICLGLSIVGARAQETNLPPAAIVTNQVQTNLSFSIVNPTNRADWQKRLTLGAGDVLNFSLFGQPDLARAEVFIGPDGRVSYLEAQDVMASGLTVDELRTNMDNELNKFRRAARTMITPVAFHSKKYYMLGKVAQKGVYTLDRPITILEAVARAHGLETGLSDRNSIDLADLQRSFLARHGKRIPIDFEKLFAHGDLSQNIAIEPDDYLYFPSASLKEIYVLGEVRSPGVTPYTTDLTVVGAISARGGFTDAAYKTHVVVIRGSFHQPKTYVVDTWAIFDARAQDFKLEPKDIIYVSGRPFLRAEQLLDLAATAFIESLTAEWAGKYIGPIISPGSFPGPP
ncbi:MAG: Polysaccharide export protein [Pedosphaera sp.]|nr:Polysaccharide export protein [Pedosphaera sp.]